MMGEHFPTKRCGEGQQLYDGWTAAMLDGDFRRIHRAMRSYFQHKNGLGGGEPCQTCRMAAAYTTSTLTYHKPLNYALRYGRGWKNLRADIWEDRA